MLLSLKVLDFKSLSWSKLEAKIQSESAEPVFVAPCAGHSLVIIKYCFVVISDKKLVYIPMVVIITLSDCVCLLIPVDSIRKQDSLTCRTHQGAYRESQWLA